MTSDRQNIRPFKEISSLNLTGRIEIYFWPTLVPMVTNFGRNIAVARPTKETQSRDSCIKQGFSRSCNLTLLLKYISDGPLLPWQRKFGNF